MSTKLIPKLKIAGSGSWPDLSEIGDLPRGDLRSSPASTARRHRGWWIWGLLVAAGFLAMGVDMPLSRVAFEGSAFQHPSKAREQLHDFLGSFEAFAQPPAILAVSLAVILCGGSRRQAGVRILVSFALASAVSNSVKLCVARVRPRTFDFEGTVLDTFRGLFRGTAGGTEFQSFPSGHTTAAVAFALALATVFPRARWLFAALAALVALQRIECGAHYLSDTLFAASLAWGVHVAVFGNGRLGRWFDKLGATPSGG